MYAEKGETSYGGLEVLVYLTPQESKDLLETARRLLQKPTAPSGVAAITLEKIVETMEEVQEGIHQVEYLCPNCKTEVISRPTEENVLECPNCEHVLKLTVSEAEE